MKNSRYALPGMTAVSVWYGIIPIGKNKGKGGCL